MSEKGFGSKIFGLFVETEGEKPDAPDAPAAEGDAARRERTPAEVVADLAAASGAAAGRAPRPPGPGSPVPGVGGKVDFEGIFREAGMDLAEMDRVSKAEQLLKTLPPDAPHPVQKQIVEASLKAFGFDIQRIVTAAQNQQRAIDAYVKVNENAAAHAFRETEAQITALNEKIAALRADGEKRSQTLTTLSAAARARKGELDKILSFFNSPPGAPEKS